MFIHVLIHLHSIFFRQHFVIFINDIYVFVHIVNVVEIDIYDNNDVEQQMNRHQQMNIDVIQQQQQIQQ